MKLKTQYIVFTSLSILGD